MTATAVNLALLLLRVSLALVLLVHATQKTLGWFHGPGLARSVPVFESLGHQPARPMVILASCCEVLAAAFLAAGFLTPAGAAIGAGTLLVAGLSLSLKAGTVWNAAGGGEYPLALAGGCLVAGVGGPGRWSLDARLFGPWPAGTGAVVLAVALAAAAPPLWRAARRLRGRPGGTSATGASPAPMRKSDHSSA